MTTPVSQDAGIRSGRMLVALIVSVFGYALMQTLVVPALGLLQHELHTTAAWSAWILSGFLLASAVLTPLIGRLGDQYDTRRVLLIVLVVYFVGTAGAALAGNIGELIAARVVQGVGLSVLPLSLAIIREVLPQERARTAMGMVSGVVGAGAGVGLVVGGLLADHLSWRYLFITGAVLIAVSFALVAYGVPRSTTSRRARFDPAGTVLLAIGLVTLLLALTKGPSWGWASPRVIGLFVATVVALGCLLLVERRVRDPLIDVGELAHRPTLMTHLAAFMFGAMSYIFYVALPAYARTPDAAGYGFGASITMAGLIMLPNAVTVLVFGTVTGRIARRTGPRLPVLAGFALSAIGAGLLALHHDQPWQHAVYYAVIGVGSGLIIASLPRLIADVVPARRTGVANGINNILRTVGGVVGTQITAALLASRSLPSGLPAQSTYGMLFWVAVGTCLIGVVVAPLAVAARQGQPHAEIAQPVR